MCELLALNFNRQINPVFSFVGLLSESTYHADGWGLAYYPDNGLSAAVFKEAIAGYESELASFLASYRAMKSRIFLSHIRKASAGSLAHSNCHPFTRYFQGSEWTFCHNGTLHDYPSTRKGLSYHPVGKTDSEFAFCKLLSEMKRRKITESTKSNHRFTRSKLLDVHELLIEINDFGGGSFNCNFSNSEYVFAYRDFRGARPLYFLNREYPFETTRIRDSEIEIDLNLIKNEDAYGYIVASDHLTDEAWTSFSPGQLIVFKNGKIVADLK